MSDPATWISAGAAVVSIVAAIWATKKSAKAQEASDLIQQKLLEIKGAREQDRLADRRKANVTATIDKQQIKTTRAWAYTMDVVNTGAVTARNVTLTVAGVHRFAAKVPSTIGTIDPGASHPIVLNTGVIGKQPALKIALTWEDDSGEPGSFKTTLSL